VEELQEHQNQAKRNSYDEIADWHLAHQPQREEWI